MKFSERQLELVQGAAGCLIKHLSMFRDEAVEIIARALGTVIKQRKVALESLDVSSRAERAAFLRSTVHLVREELTARRTWREAEIEKALNCFMDVMHDSWMKE